MGDTDLAPADAASALNGSTWAQDERLIAIDTPLGKDTLLLTSLVGEEAISRLFSYEIGMVSMNHALRPEAVIGQPVADPYPAGQTERTFDPWQGGDIPRRRHGCSWPPPLQRRGRSAALVPHADDGLPNLPKP